MSGRTLRLLGAGVLTVSPAAACGDGGSAGGKDTLTIPYVSGAEAVDTYGTDARFEVALVDFEDGTVTRAFGRDHDDGSPDTNGSVADAGTATPLDDDLEHLRDLADLRRYDMLTHAGTVGPFTTTAEIDATSDDCGTALDQADERDAAHLQYGESLGMSFEAILDGRWCLGTTSGYTVLLEGVELVPGELDPAGEDLVVSYEIRE